MKINFKSPFLWIGAVFLICCVGYLKGGHIVAGILCGLICAVLVFLSTLKKPSGHNVAKKENANIQFSPAFQPVGSGDAPTQKQLDYAADLGIIIPPDVDKRDVSAMISRVTGEDSLENPTPALVELASELKCEVSPYAGYDAFCRAVWGRSDDVMKAALYVYGIDCQSSGAPLGNIYKSPRLDYYRKFWNYIENDPSLVKSLLSRPCDDLNKANKNAKIYSVATLYLNNQ